MLLYVFGQSPLLPSRQTASIRRCAKRIGIAIDANEFVRKQNPQCLPILPMHQAAIFNLGLELESGLPQVPVIEEQPWLEFNLGEPQFWIGKGPLRIDVNLNRTCERTRLLRSAKVMSCGDEGKFM